MVAAVTADLAKSHIGGARIYRRRGQAAAARVNLFGGLLAGLSAPRAAEDPARARILGALAEHGPLEWSDLYGYTGGGGWGHAQMHEALAGLLADGSVVRTYPDRHQTCVPTYSLASKERT